MRDDARTDRTAWQEEIRVLRADARADRDAIRTIAQLTQQVMQQNPSLFGNSSLPSSNAPDIEPG